ncbi:MAG: hypothetical protein QXP36_14540 [Conexivisphaerales archaeon]
MTFIISHGDFKLELSVLPVKELKPHEETLKQGVDELKSSLINMRLQYDPVIIDSKTKVILDGMHRHKAMQELHFKLILVCAVNYLDERIGIKRWLRSSRMNEDQLGKIARTLSLEKEGRYGQVMQMVDQQQSCLGILSEKVSYYSKPCGGKDKLKEMVRTFDQFSNLIGVRVEYISEDNIMQKVREGFSVLYTQLPSKQDVIESALSGRLFPPKSTRHTIPARPVAIGFPLEYLSLERTNSENRLSELLRGKRFMEMPPGSFYEGRKYEETIYLLE